LGLGSSGAIVFAGFFVFLVISFRRISIGLLAMIAVGLYCACEGSRIFFEEKRKHQDPKTLS